MSELTEKEKAFESADVISECVGMTKLQAMEHYFYKAWDIQQSKIDELVKALESIAFMEEKEADKITYWLKVEISRLSNTIANDTFVAREALKKYRGE